MNGRFETEAEGDAALRELKLLVPDPRVSDLIFWPERHPLSASIPDKKLTAELVVELAMRYEPFSL